MPMAPSRRSPRNPRLIQQNQDGITQRMAQAEQTNAQMQGELNLVTDKLKMTRGTTGGGTHPGQADPRRLHQEAHRRADHSGDQGQRG